MTSSVTGSLADKYAEIEKQLIDDFRRAYYDGDLQRMKNITSILSNFKVILLQLWKFKINRAVP